MKGARWRALGTQAFFSSANCLRIRSDKFTKLLLQAAPVTAWALARGSWPRRGQVCFAILPCSPGCSCWDLPWRWHTACETKHRPSSPPGLGCCLLILHKLCWQVSLNGFNSPVISKKENRLLTGVGLDDLTDYFLLSVSHFDDPVSHPVF